MAQPPPWRQGPDRKRRVKLSMNEPRPPAREVALLHCLPRDCWISLIGSVGEGERLRWFYP
jgi:hypothetical protein